MQGEYRGDFTRDTFNPVRHYSRVLMQQGRVLLDEDWNEQTSILLHYLRTLAKDLIGPHRGPGESDFKIEERKDGNNQPVKFDFAIGQGRYYVDGILCENNNDGPVAYTNQNDFPLKNGKSALESADHLVYLDVWERHITALEDGLIREVALGGPDTATRAQVVWQVKVDNVNARSGLRESEMGKRAIALESALEGNDEEQKRKSAEEYLSFLADNELQPKNRGVLRARAQKADEPDEPCAISPESRYRGAENHLYRVEVHKGGDKNTATFKWSRDNGSIVFPILSLGDGKVTLAHLGRDIGGSLQVNDWVEIVDDDLVLHGEPGLLRRVESIDPVEMSVTLSDDPKNKTPLPSDVDDMKHPLLRRWDFQGDGLEDKALTLEEGKGEEDKDWISLEVGIQIQFYAAQEGQPNTYRSGDYWLIPARVATGDVEWPKERNGIAKALPPHGVEHHYAPLAVISAGADGTVARKLDCRRFLS